MPDSPTESEVAGSAVEIDLQEQIRRRAYELYEQRGKEDGHDVDDWLQAESYELPVSNSAEVREREFLRGARKALKLPTLEHVLIVGYQTQGSLGRRLVERLNAPS